MGSWKSSPLTLFFHFILIQPRRQVKSAVSDEKLDTVDGMRKAAAGINARAIPGTLGGIELSLG